MTITTLRIRKKNHALKKNKKT
jgi:hypothetical protein